MELQRTLYSAKLVEKTLLSARAQTWHLEFECARPFDFLPGQFISVLAERRYPAGHLKAGQTRQDTRAYSLANAPEGKRIELCLNRVSGDDERGFFSNLLCDLQIGESIRFHGPHGDFVLREQNSRVVFGVHDTGIAPVRAMVQAINANGFAADAEFWLVQASANEGDLYYSDFFESVAAAHARFHYLPVIAADDPGARLAEAVLRVASTKNAPQQAYLCGLNEAIAPPRAALKALGWERRQIVYERYD